MNNVLPQETNIFLSLIDIIFGVLIGATFVSFSGELVPPKPTFDTAALFVAFYIIILSWVFFHKAIVSQQLKIGYMLIIDLLLLYFYFVINLDGIRK